MGVSITNLSLYVFRPLEDLEAWRKRFEDLCQDCGLKGTVLLAPEGMNCFVAGSSEAIDRYESALRDWFSDPALAGKRSPSEDVPFKRLFVKIKKEIITFGVTGVHPEQERAAAIEPEMLRDWIREGRDFTLLDTRNAFEFEVGSFELARHLDIQKFTEFPDAVKTLPEETKKKPVVMFCTGGIRCEKAGLYLRDLGFQDVRQLEGGILKYFEKCGGEAYRGSCFVFDRRIAVGPDLQKAEVPPGTPLMARVE